MKERGGGEGEKVDLAQLIIMQSRRRSSQSQTDGADSNEQTNLRFTSVSLRLSLSVFPDFEGRFRSGANDTLH